MRRSICSFIFSVLVLVLCVQACDFFLREYDIKVINDTDFEFEVYIDDIYQFSLDPGSTATIGRVKSGSHALEARVRDRIVADRIVDLDSNMKWTVYVDTYDIKVINDTDYELSIYLDNVFQFELGVWDTATIAGVSGGVYAIDARSDGRIIADRVLTVDKDINWTIYQGD